MSKIPKLLPVYLFSFIFINQVKAKSLDWLSQPDVDIGNVANNEAKDVKISRNGRYITYTSKASNMVNNDNNHIEDLFIKDRQTGVTELVSVTSSGTQSSNGRIIQFSTATSDGRYVAFTSDSPDYPSANETENYLYIKDMQTGELINESLYAVDSYFEINFGGIHLSDDARYMTFSTSSEIDPIHTNNQHQVYRKDRTNMTFELLSISEDGLSTADRDAKMIDTSNTGRYVLISSQADNLTTDEINNIGENLFIHDTQLDTMTLVNITPTSVNSGDSNFFNNEAAISNNGQVVFMSEQSDLVTNDNNNRDDVFFFDNGSIIRINVDENGDELTNTSNVIDVAISGDGSRIAFTEYSDELFPDYTNDYFDLYSYETGTGALSLISKTTSDIKVDGSSYKPHLSTTGNRVVFLSYATDLTNEPAFSQHLNVYQYSFTNDNMKNESLAAFTPNTIISNALDPSTSSDQISVIYTSKSPNLVPEPIDNTLDLFLLNRNSGTHSRIASNVSSYAADISTSGDFITFRSRFLPPDGLTELGDYFIFLYDRLNISYTQVAEGGLSKVNDDGVVVFTSYENIDANDSNGLLDLYAYNPLSQNIILISKDMNGNATSIIDMDLGGENGEIWVAFSSNNSNIVANDTNGHSDVFLKNVTSDTEIARITETFDGIEANGESSNPSISDDGNWVAFLTSASNLTSDNLLEASDRQAMVFDSQNHSFTLVSINQAGMPLTDEGTNGIGNISLSDSGRYVSYTFLDNDKNIDPNLTKTVGTMNPEFSGDTDLQMDIVLFDMDNQSRKIISNHSNGTPSDDDVFEEIHIVEDLNATPPMLGVVFSADGGDLTGLISHPGHREIYMYQQEILDPDIIFRNGFE